MNTTDIALAKAGVRETIDNCVITDISPDLAPC